MPAMYEMVREIASLRLREALQTRTVDRQPTSLREMRTVDGRNLDEALQATTMPWAVGLPPFPGGGR